MKRIWFPFAFICVALCASGVPEHHLLTSPDGKLSVEIVTGEKISYSLSHEGVQLLSPSDISMTLDNGATVYGRDFRLRKILRRSVDRLVQAQVYKKAEVRDCFNELILKFKGYSVIFRAYDEGMAYRFVSESGRPFTVLSEQAEFNFPADFRAWVPYVTKKDSWERQFFNSFENHYADIRLSEWDADRLAFLPLLVEAPQGRKLCITESDLLNYPGMCLHNGDASTTLTGVYAKYPKTVEGIASDSTISFFEGEPDFVIMVKQ